MRKLRCISCGDTINKSSNTDPYICRECEPRINMMSQDRYAYLDQ